MFDLRVYFVVNSSNFKGFILTSFSRLASELGSRLLDVGHILVVAKHADNSQEFNLKP